VRRQRRFDESHKGRRRGRKRKKEKEEVQKLDV